MRARRFVIGRAHQWLVGAAAPLLVLLLACPGCNVVIGLDRVTFDIGGTGGGGGTGGTTTTTVDPGCIPNQTGDAIEDACGVFVSAANGTDSNAGTTKAQPVATLKKAIALAKGKPIYACADAAKTFSGAITLDGDAQLFGGLDCTSWKYVAGTKTTWTASADETPLHVTAKGSAVVADFVIEAANATKDGGSSIAIVAEANATVSLSRCEVKAGDAMAGLTPEAPMGSGMGGLPGDPGLDGCVDTMGKLGGNGGALTCDSADVSGGPGGNGIAASSGGPGGDGNPTDVATGLGGLPQKESPAADCTNGGDGVEGLPGDPGAGATGNGSLSSTGFTGESGKDGATLGKPGQGGGGGGGAKKCAMPTNYAGPSAGGGGSGGCGGAVGKGGGAGGASLAIVSLGANLLLADVTITTKAGGKGGDGGAGQPGGDGGLGGKPGSNNGDMSSAACAGGKGGKGGAGGRGGGGRGGPSIGIAFTGDAPDVKGATITAGKAGDGGDGDGAMGMGANGAAAETQAF